MPFAYYGSKHGLAARYPRPMFPTIIEPFAGAAGYSSHYATPAHRVILNDADPEVVALWHRLQSMTVAELDAIRVGLGERTADVLVAGSGGASSVADVLGGRTRQVTPRMVKDWPMVRARIASVLPLVAEWRIVQGSYADLADIEATWFVDPPYRPMRADYHSTSGAGNGYRFGSDGIDYDHLAEWCRTRRGQVIVCEQSPADWLPFTPIATQGNAVADATSRTEVVWLSTQQQLRMW